MTTYTSQQKALAIVPKFSGALSMLGSAFIFQHVIRSPKRRKLVYHRILLLMSASDFILSTCFFLSTWPVPEGTAYGAVGTTASCAFVGFFDQAAALMTPMYNAVLSTYYLLVIRYGWSERRMKTVQAYLLAVPPTFGFATSIAGLPLTLFNNAGWNCWIAALPTNCDKSDDIVCERGDNAWIYRWAFLYAPVWFIFVLMAVLMFMVYTHVLKHEKIIEKYRGSVNGKEATPATESRSKSKKVANQAMLYLGAFYLTWIFGTLTRIIQMIEGVTYFPLIMLMATFFPLQGFWNCLIYLRPRYLRYKQRNPDSGALTVVKRGVRDVRYRMSLFNSSKGKDPDMLLTNSTIRKVAGDSSITKVADESNITKVADESRCDPSTTPNADSSNQVVEEIVENEEARVGSGTSSSGTTNANQYIPSATDELAEIVDT